MLVDAERVVRLNVTVRDDAGEKLQIDSNTIDVIIGFGQLVPKVEHALVGLGVGARCMLTLEPAEAFGERDASRIVDFDKEEFPADVAAGDQFEAESEEVGLINFTVLHVDEDHVQVDMNHALAGRAVQIEFEVLAIRPANSEEIDSARKRRDHDDFEPTNGLLPAKALLKGRSRR